MSPKEMAMADISMLEWFESELSDVVMVDGKGDLRFPSPIYIMMKFKISCASITEINLLGEDSYLTIDPSSWDARI